MDIGDSMTKGCSCVMPCLVLPVSMDMSHGCERMWRRRLLLPNTDVGDCLCPLHRRLRPALAQAHG